jgi:SAM-dependent methyltransferase
MHWPFEPMLPHALLPYEQALETGEPLRLYCEDGRSIPLDIQRWIRKADAVDHDAVVRAMSPALDIGCGPGRIVEALSAAGRMALGIDIAAAAVRLARDRGVNALRRDVFFRLPREGEWGSALLLDGNIGIGGDPTALLSRAAALVAVDGVIVVETDGTATVDERLVVRFADRGDPIGPPFAWAKVGLAALARYAAAAELRLLESWTAGGRTFALLGGSGITATIGS